MIKVWPDQARELSGAFIVSLELATHKVPKSQPDFQTKNKKETVPSVSLPKLSIITLPYYFRSVNMTKYDLL